MSYKRASLAITILTAAGIAGALADQRNVSLATAGGVVTVSSFMDGTDNGEAASACLIDGKWLNQASDDPRGMVWRSYRYSKSPQWAWIRFAGPRRVDRVVLHASSKQNHPIDYRIQTSDDGGVTVKDVAVVKNQVAQQADALAMEVKFPAVITDNVRVWIERSGAVPGETHSESTQLAEIEVFGTDVSSGISPATGAQTLPLPSGMLSPTPGQDLKIVEDDEQVTLTSPWQKLVLDKRTPAIRFFAVDSEGQGRLRVNLVQKDGIRPRMEPAYGKVIEPSAVKLERQGNVFRYAPVTLMDGVDLAWEIRVGPQTLDMALARRATRRVVAKPGMIRFGWDGGQTASLPYYKPEQIGFVGLPLLLHAADQGSVLLTSDDRSVAGFAWRGREYAGQNPAWENADLSAAMPTRPDGLTVIDPGLWQGRCSFKVGRVTPLASFVAADPRLKDIGFSRFMLNGMPFRPDSHVLSNSPTSINCGFCMFEYADMAAFLPTLPGGIDASDLLRTSFDQYMTGGCDAYTGYSNIFDPDFKSPVDTKPSLLIAAWTVIRKTGDMELLKRWMPAIERLSSLMEEADEDGDGLLEITKSTNGGSWYDVYANKGKSAHGNAMAYRAFGCAADLQHLAGQTEKAKHLDQLANRIRAAYLPAFLNPATGVICGWRTKDGVCHDHWFPWLSGMAISLGLVPDKEANEIIDRFQAKFKEVGFSHFELGMPNCLESIDKDYGQNEKGEAAHAFKFYLNGGVTPCFSYHYLQALYRLNRRAEADAILMPMLRQFDQGRFNGGAECRRTPSIDPATGKDAIIGREWSDWEGTPQTGEGFLPDSYHVLGALWTGYCGIHFGPDGYQLTPWSPLKGTKVPLGLTYMGKAVTTIE